MADPNEIAVFDASSSEEEGDGDAGAGQDDICLGNVHHDGAQVRSFVLLFRLLVLLLPPPMRARPLRLPQDQLGRQSRIR